MKHKKEFWNFENLVLRLGSFQKNKIIVNQIKGNDPLKFFSVNYVLHGPII